MGREICLAARDRDISAATIIATARERAINNWKRYKRDFKPLLERIRANPLSADVIAYLHEHGIGRIHDTDDIHAALDGTLTDEQVEHAINELADVGFVTRTGISNQVVFVQSPALAHTLGVVMHNMGAYHGAPAFFAANVGQMSLLLPHQQEN